MNIDEILKELDNAGKNKVFPLDIVKEAVSKEKMIAPYLIDSLDTAFKEAKGWQTSSLYIFAVYLLAQFRNKEAFPKLVRFLNMDGDILDEMFADRLTENYSTILSSTYNGNFILLEDVVKNQKLYKFARLAALDAIEMLFRRGMLKESYWKECVYNLILLEQDDDSVIGAELTNFVIKYKFFEFATNVQSLFDQERIDRFFIKDYSEFLVLLHSDKFQCDEQPLFIEDVTEVLQTGGMFSSNIDKKTIEIEDLILNINIGH